VSHEKLKEVTEQAEKMKRNLEEKAQRERDEIIRRNLAVKEASDSLQSEVQRKQQEIESQKKMRKETKEKLTEIEAKLIQGTKLLNQSEKDKVEVERKKTEIEQKKVEAARVQRELAEREEAKLSLVEKYETQEKELTAKTKKLNRLKAKFQEITQETEDFQAESQKEREELLETIRKLRHHVELKKLILENFVPHEDRAKIESRMVWDKEKETYIVKPPDYQAMNQQISRPSSTKPNVARPTADLTLKKASRGDPNPRFRHDNVLDIPLDGVPRTTLDFGTGTASHSAQQDHGNSREDADERWRR